MANLETTWRKLIDLYGEVEISLHFFEAGNFVFEKRRWTEADEVIDAPPQGQLAEDGEFEIRHRPYVRVRLSRNTSKGRTRGKGTTKYHRFTFVEETAFEVTRTPT
jgi:hypothetical protein